MSCGTSEMYSARHKAVRYSSSHGKHFQTCGNALGDVNPDPTKCALSKSTIVAAFSCDNPVSGAIAVTDRVPRDHDERE